MMRADRANPASRPWLFRADALAGAMVALLASASAGKAQDISIYFVGCAAPTGFHGYLARGAEEAGKNLGVNVTYIYPDQLTIPNQVQKIEEAIDHISRYGYGYTECIVAEDGTAAERFLRDLDSAILLHNASTQFADGGEFGFGAEIGIATGRMHARGPVGVEQLTSFKYRVRGSGQTRP